MHVILWQFEVAAEKAAAFVAAYSGNGAWAQLFRQAPGYLGTELLRCAEDPKHYMTIDRWSSAEDFTRFQRDFGDPTSRSMPNRKASPSAKRRSAASPAQLE
jgi:heme-degrading monooxygenase HmoA